jgi:DNA repair protein RadC
VRQWNKDDQPRTKILDEGANSLSDTELVGIILGTGTKTRNGSLSAVQLGRVLIATFGSLVSLARRFPRELERIDGVGPAKAAQLAAAFELGRRVEAESLLPGSGHTQIGSPADVAAYFGPQMRDLKREVFRVVLLNTSNVVLSTHVISEGGLASSIVEPRAVFQMAILKNAAALICLHNHPSGNPEPSREDVRITRQLVEAGRLMGIPVHDHLIIAGHNFTSLAERGLME